MSAYPQHVPSSYNSRKVGLFVIQHYIYVCVVIKSGSESRTSNTKALVMYARALSRLSSVCSKVSNKQVKDLELEGGGVGVRG
jgi:hypothetical protein